MAHPPFENTRLAPHEKLDQAKQQELFDAITRNFEHAYTEFATTAQVREAKKAVEAKPIVSGIITSAGGITAGSGFTVGHTETGRYIIKLTAAATTTLVPVVSLFSAPATNTGIEVTSAGKQEFLVSTFVIAGTTTNSGFTFH